MAVPLCKVPNGAAQPLTAYVGLSKKENVNVKCKNIFLEKCNLSFQFSNFWWYLVDHISSLSAI